MTKAERTLESIIRQAETLRPTNEDDGLYYLLGSIVANAEDALGSIREEQRQAAFDAAIRGGFRFVKR